MKVKLAIAITAVFLSGIWSGYVLRYAQVGMFGYEPCWNDLMDVNKERRFQDNLGDDGWDYRNATVGGNCVLVDPRYTFKGFRKMTRDEIVEASREF